MGATKRALILTAGGGRGAYHLGALTYLEEIGWLGRGRLPDYIAGASIGSVNGAALIEGLSPAELYARWKGRLTTELVQEAAGHWALRPLLDALLRGDYTPEPAESDGEVLGGGGGWGAPLHERIADMVDGKVRDILAATMDQPHLYQSHWPRVLGALGLSPALPRVNAPDAPALVVPAVDVRRGSKRVFCNKPWRDWQGHDQPAVRFGFEHLNASASIQVAYQYGLVDDPADRSPRKRREFWDGAVADATPLDSLIDVVRGRGDRLEDLEIVVVLLAPWHRPEDDGIPLPAKLYETFTPALDWMMLAPFTVALKRLADKDLPMPTIIAPSGDFWRTQMALDRVVEYRAELHERLYERAYEDARAAMGGRPAR